MNAPGFRVYDTFSRRLRLLPVAPSHVGIYVCGPTVYRRAHIGNARPFVVFSWLARYLRACGHTVTFVHNITDVNDKIYEHARGEPSGALADRATGWYLADIERFGLGMPDVLPRVTTTMGEIVAFIARLLSSGHAYQLGGDVYFSVAQFEGYGVLSGRIRADDYPDDDPGVNKRDGRDFALWKATKPGEDTSWAAPWGAGRPGWHIECTAMAERHLGPRFDIHGAGIDILFPHNENERAQSRAVGDAYADVWMHNGMLKFDGEKMSKSLGNVVSIKQVLDRWGSEAGLLFFMAGHWRSELTFSNESMTMAANRAHALRDAIGDGATTEQKIRGVPNELREVLDDDFNTAEALRLMHTWAHAGALEKLAAGLGIFGLNSLLVRAAVPTAVADLAAAREVARAEKRFKDADLLRTKIEEAGFEVRDQRGRESYDIVPRRHP